MKKTKKTTRLILCALSFAAFLTAQMTARAQILAHEFSFWLPANDSATTVTSTGTPGGNVGTLNGSAAITGGQLQLVGGYVQLQPGIVTNDAAVTVEAWIDLPPLAQQGVWGNLFDFGTKDVNNNDSYSISFCVNVSSPPGVFDAAISDFDNANVNRQNCYADGNPLAGLSGQYVAAVYNPPAGYIAMYINGVQVSTIPITNTITPGVRDVNNEIGWDNWPDPTMIGNIDEFRVWNGALNGLQIASSFTSGFTNVDITNAGAVTSYNVAANSPLTLGSQENATATATAANTGSLSIDLTTLSSFTSLNTNIFTVSAGGVLKGVALGTATLQATYGANVATVQVTVVEPASVLAHRYSFNDTQNTTGVSVADSIGTLNGTLYGDAIESNSSLVLDGTTGTYLDLSSNSYANHGIISGYQSATIDMWATFGTQSGNWDYAYSFGSEPTGFGGDNFLYYTFHGGAGNFLNLNGLYGVNDGGNFDNQAIHITTLIDPTSGILAIFTNGVLNNYATGATGFQLSHIDTNLIFIGRSLWTTLGPPAGTGDPYTIGSFKEIRVYNGSLSPAQIAMSDQSGPNSTNDNPGTLVNVSLAVPATIQMGDEATPGLIGNYTSLTNFNITKNSLTPLLIFNSSNTNVVYQGTDGLLHATAVGTAAVSVNYQGFSATQMVTVVRPPPPVLVHEYQFHDAVGSGTANDSVGGAAWAGTLPNGGTFSGTNLYLDSASSQYVALPSGVIQSNGTGGNYGSMTVDVWVVPVTEPFYSMLYSFGNTDSGNLGEDYIFGSIPRNYTCITAVDPGYNAEEGIFGGPALPTNELAHFTGVYNLPEGYIALYNNGVLQGVNYGVVDPASVVSDAEANIGRSVYTGDPYATLTLVEFRIYNGVLLGDQVQASDDLGPSVPLANPNAATLSAARSSGSVVLTWPETETGFSVYSKNTLNAAVPWTLVSGTPTLANHIWTLTIPASSAAAYYELGWPY